MATIYLDPTITKEAEQRVRELAELTPRVNPDWKGAILTVERGDFTYVDGCGEIAASTLLAEVFQAIDSTPG